MSTQPKLRVPQLRTYLNLIATRIVRETAPLTGIELLDPAEARFDAPPDTGAWKPAAIGDFWGAKQHYACFKATAAIPAHWLTDGVEIRMEHEARYLEPTRMIADTFPAGPEGQLFINGQRAGAIDAQHHRIRYPFQPGEAYDVRAVFFAARCECRHVLRQWELTWIDMATEKLAYDLSVALDVVEQLDPASVAREHLLRAVEATVQAVDFRETTVALALPAERRRDPAGELFYASLPAAQAAFDKALTKVPPAGDVPAIILVGHAHIDLAWLWPFAVAQHKCVRTFGTQVRLLEQYPDWVFQQSSAQAYAWVERIAPDLFDRIRQHVAADRWEADGATWVEMDTNLVGGESLVRQFVYGKRYFREKFGTDSRMLWLPDVFGYSAALPQIMRLAGVDGFVTQKLSWNQTNRFPHHTFRWRGLDGTETLSHFPVGTYNAMTTDAPISEIKDSWDRYEQKAELLDPVLPFGWGDGGGGPTEKMLEIARRLAASPVAGMPKVRLEKAGDVLRRLLPHVDRLPVWDGELYLEYHRGTYTSQAWLKRANRKNEIRLHNLEWLAAVARAHGFTLDKARIDQVWQDLLLMQFHDVLPGSSVGEVYDEVREMQGRVASEADAMCANATALLCLKIDTSACSEPVVLFNTLAWSRREPVQLPDGTWRDDIAVPASGWAVVDAAKPVTSSAESSLTFSQDGRTLGNRYWRLRLDAQGRLMELYDRINDRQVLPVGAVANEWQVFEDRPLDFDAWDIDAYYQEYPLPAPTCERLEVVEHGPVRVAIELTWRMPLIERGPQSTIVQRIALYANDPRIDFETKADWHDHHQLLKVAFPVDIRATEATHEIQFGHVRRPTHHNTTFDAARFEVCSHRFVDLAEHGYGVTLLNDCKYGHDIHDGTIRLTCIRAPQAPDARADLGAHEFTYALLPHAGTFQDAEIVRRAAELNTPLLVQSVKHSPGDLPAMFSYVACQPTAVVLDTMKPAEDGRGTILRLYEAHGSHTPAALTFATAPKKVEIVNLLEEPMDDEVGLTQDGTRVALRLRPFQIVTLRVMH